MSVDEVKALIGKIKSLDLKSASHEELKGLLQQLGKFCVIESTLHNNYELIRACSNKNLFETFDNVDRVSYKPQEFNKTYLRASTPNQTMFYGCSQQFDNPKRVESIGRITALIESMPKLRNKTLSGIFKITFGRWAVNSDIKLIAICHHKEMVKKPPQMEMMFDSYQELVKKTPEILEQSILVSEFLADEFSKDVEVGNEHEYKISAIFTEIVVEKGFDGVAYPSLRTAGDGINIAITPEKVIKSLECSVVGECIIFKNKDSIAVLDNCHCFIEKGQKDFQLKKPGVDLFKQPIFVDTIGRLNLHEIADACFLEPVEK